MRDPCQLAMLLCLQYVIGLLSEQQRLSIPAIALLELSFPVFRWNYCRLRTATKGFSIKEAIS